MEEKEIIGKVYVPQDNSWAELLDHEGIENFQGLYHREGVIVSEPYKREVSVGDVRTVREFVDVRSLDTGMLYRVLWNEAWIKPTSSILSGRPEGIIGKWYVVDRCYARDLVTGRDVAKDGYEWFEEAMMNRAFPVVSNPYEAVLPKKDVMFAGEGEGVSHYTMVNIFHEGRVYQVMFDEWHLKDKEAGTVGYKWL